VTRRLPGEGHRTATLDDVRISPLAVVAALGGVATRDQLLDAGARGVDVSRVVREGELVRVRRAHYALPDAPRDAFSAVRVGGRLGCVSALASYGVWTSASSEVHVALPANAARLRTNRALVAADEPLTSDRGLLHVELHWTDIPFGARVDESAWRVPVERALAGLARCRPHGDVAAAFESAVTLGLIALDTAQRLADASVPERMPPIVLGGHDGSGVETLLAIELRALGVAFIQQVPFDGVGFVDFLVAGRLVVETDGYAHHSDRAAFVRDRRRDEELLRRGIPTLRLAASDVIADPRAAALRVVEALCAMD
jgi:very-short-patch-repair endonuclease